VQARIGTPTISWLYLFIYLEKKISICYIKTKQRLSSTKKKSKKLINIHAYMRWKNWFKVTPLPTYQTMYELNQWTDSKKNGCLNWFKFTHSLACIFPVKVNSKSMKRKTSYSLIWVFFTNLYHILLHATHTFPIKISPS
jgi:hypothetical protein